MKKFSIIIPVYNESLNIISLINEILETLPENEFKFEIILVNDASTDNTENLINKLIKVYPKNIKLLNNKKNLGQSVSLMEGIKKSSYETIVTMDGDGQNHPKDVPVLLNKYFKEKDIYLVGGIRKKRKDNLIKIFSSKIANSIRKNILDDDCVDTGCSLKVFDKNTFLKLPFFDGIHRFLPALFKGFGTRTYFINVEHRARIHGHSKYGVFDRLLIGIIDIFKVIIIINNIKNND